MIFLASPQDPHLDFFPLFPTLHYLRAIWENLGHDVVGRSCWSLWLKKNQLWTTWLLFFHSPFCTVVQHSISNVLNWLSQGQVDVGSVWAFSLLLSIQSPLPWCYSFSNTFLSIPKAMRLECAQAQYISLLWMVNSAFPAVHFLLSSCFVSTQLELLSFKHSWFFLSC